jgi:arylsulfatase A-like enzyme
MINNTLFFILLAICNLISATTIVAKQGLNKNNTEGKPNIIYVLADDLGYGDITCFNSNSKIKTPHLDQLGADGMIFTDAHTSSSVCTPTRYGILTGRYNWRSTLKKSVLFGKSPALIDENRETVASMLKKSGYNTAFIGKWHLGWNWTMNNKEEIDFSKPVTKTPNSNGFDYAYGHCGSLDMAPYVYVENGNSTAIPTETTENRDYQGVWRKGLTAPDFKHEDVTPNFFRRSIAFIQEQAKTSKPFFLYLPIPSPHTPILPTKEWQGKSGLNPYGDFVMMIDGYMRQLIKAVKDAGIENNTLIIFTSDNGCSPRAKFDELIEKGHNPSDIYRGHKADIFEGGHRVPFIVKWGHRVPFIVKWPGTIKPGSDCNKTICTTDFMATCASIVDYKLKDNMAEDSFDMLPLFRNPKSKKYSREATVHHSINGSFAIRKGDWKFILCPDSGGWSYPRPGKDKVDLPQFQLYNLKTDPGEKDNLYTKRPEIENELKQILTDYINNGRSTPGANQKNDYVEKWPQIWWMKN